MSIFNIKEDAHLEKDEFLDDIADDYEYDEIDDDEFNEDYEDDYEDNDADGPMGYKKGFEYYTAEQFDLTAHHNQNGYIVLNRRFIANDAVIGTYEDKNVFIKPPASYKVLGFVFDEDSDDYYIVGEQRDDFRNFCTALAFAAALIYLVFK